MADKNKGGRPPMYKSADEMTNIIEEYFKSCEGTILKDTDGELVYDKYGRPVIVGQKPPTVTGLALALGFNCRLSLLNYQGKDEFVNTITRAKARIEEYAETRLFDKDGVQGAKFSLANNFKEWREKSETENKNHNSNTDENAIWAEINALPEPSRSKCIDEVSNAKVGEIMGIVARYKK